MGDASLASAVVRQRVSLRKANEIAAERMGRIDPVERWLHALWIWVFGATDTPTTNHR